MPQERPQQRPTIPPCVPTSPSPISHGAFQASPRPLWPPAREADLASYFAEKIEDVRRARPHFPATPTYVLRILALPFLRPGRGVRHLSRANPTACAKIPLTPTSLSSCPTEQHPVFPVPSLPQWASQSQHKSLIRSLLCRVKRKVLDFALAFSNSLFPC